MYKSVRFSLILMIALWSSAVLAQPESLEAAEEHNEEVAIEADPASASDDTRLEIAGGAALNTGNARSFAANAGASFDLRRSRHQFGAEARFIYGTASIKDGNTFQPWQLNSRNLYGRARYDFFMTNLDALFLAVAPRWDTFAGLAFRIQNQIGYARDFYNVNNKHRLWGEIGYDLTHDEFFLENPNDAAGNPIPTNQTNHSVRAYVGYDNHLREDLTFRTGVEALFNLDPDKAEDVRVNWNAELRANIIGALQVGVDFAVLFDNLPPPNAQKLDTITTLNLLYAMDFDPEEPPAEEPAPCTPCPEPCSEPAEVEAEVQAVEEAEAAADGAVEVEAEALKQDSAPEDPAVPQAAPAAAE